MGVFLKYLFQLVLSPGHGWEDIGRARQHPRVLAATGFYPLTALTALSVFAGKIYHSMLTLQDMLIDAVITFMMYFLGYFTGTFVLSVGLAAILDINADDRRCQTFSIFVMGLLEIIAIIGNIIPMTLAITWFLPCYVAIIMWKGCAYMEIPRENTGRFMLIAVPGVLIPPYLIQLFFTLILK